MNHHDETPINHRWVGYTSPPNQQPTKRSGPSRPHRGFRSPPDPMRFAIPFGLFVQENPNNQPSDRVHQPLSRTDPPIRGLDPSQPYSEVFSVSPDPNPPQGSSKWTPPRWPLGPSNYRLNGVDYSKKQYSVYVIDTVRKHLPACDHASA